MVKSFHLEILQLYLTILLCFVESTVEKSFIQIYEIDDPLYHSVSWQSIKCTRDKTSRISTKSRAGKVNTEKD